MSAKVQTIGLTFGRLTVKSRDADYVGPTGKRRLKFICQCLCGKEASFLGENLRRGHSTSCGCVQDENRRKRAKDATGLRFGRLTVIGEAEKYVSPQGVELRQVRAVCDCGTEITTHLKALKAGLTASCGCYRTELAVANIKHGDNRKASPTREYKAWSNMIRRCESPKVERYHCYGGRGIKVCSEWRNSFEAFLRDMGRKPSPEYSIDRKDVNGNYEPGNCRWATPTEQANNTRRSRAA